jgi:hypothetical protein
MKRNYKNLKTLGWISKMIGYMSLFGGIGSGLFLGAKLLMGVSVNASLYIISPSLLIGGILGIVTGQLVKLFIEIERNTRLLRIAVDERESFLPDEKTNKLKLPMKIKPRYDEDKDYLEKRTKYLKRLLRVDYYD